MLDVQSNIICEGDLVAYIQNTRGEKPRLMYAIVSAVNKKSIHVRLVNGETVRLSYSHRSFADSRLNNVVAIKSRQIREGEFLDCTEYPIFDGDRVAFMEVPSQGFSTSLVIGEVIKVVADEVTITVKSKVDQKYLRKPDQVVVVDSC